MTKCEKLAACIFEQVSMCNHVTGLKVPQRVAGLGACCGGTVNTVILLVLM